MAISTLSTMLRPTNAILRPLVNDIDHLLNAVNRGSKARSITVEGLNATALQFAGDVRSDAEAWSFDVCRIAEQSEYPFVAISRKNAQSKGTLSTVSDRL